MKRTIIALLLMLCAAPTFAARIYYSSTCGPQGGWVTTSTLTTDAPPASFPCALAWTEDNGEMYSDGTNWISIKPVPTSSYSNVDFQSGLVTSIVGTKGTYYQVVKASTVDNMIASASALVCVTNPTIALLECGTSTSCSSPTTIASVQVTGTGAATPATLSSSAITAGDYVGWQLTGGVCTSLNLSATAQLHTN